MRVHVLYMYNVIFSAMETVVICTHQRLTHPSLCPPSYCLTNEDASKDTKWTKIQQRCLISERAGHCNSVSTPRAERNQRQSRRLKEVQLQNKKQQKQRENEGQKRKDSFGSCKGEEGGKTLTSSEKENGAENGDNRTEGEIGGQELSMGRDGGVVLKSRRSLQFPRNDVRMIKSPTVKITRVSPRQRQFAKPTKLVGKKKMAALRSRTTKSAAAVTPQEVAQLTTVTKQSSKRRPTGSVDDGRVATSAVKKEPPCSSTSKDTPDEMDIQGRRDSTVGQEDGDDSSVVMERPSSLHSPVSPTCASYKGVWPSPVRRSPRLKGKMAESHKKEASSLDGGTKGKKSDAERKEKSLKAVSHHMLAEKLLRGETTSRNGIHTIPLSQLHVLRQAPSCI